MTKNKTKALPWQTELEKLEEALGSKIGTWKEGWRRHLTEGVLIDITVGRWRGNVKLRPSDLGIDLGEGRDVFNLGVKRLMPNELLKKGNSIESAARKRAIRDAISSPWGSKFLPVTAFEETTGDLKKHEARYWALRDELAGSDEAYSEWVGQVRIEYLAAARTAWFRMQQSGQLPEQWVDDEEGFVDTYVTRVMSHIPSREEIWDSFEWRISYTYIPLPNLLAEERAEAENIDATVRLSKEQAAAEAELVWAKVQEEKARERAITEATESAADHRQRMLEEMNRGVVEQARAERDALIEEFFVGAAREIRQTVYDVLAPLQEKLDANGKLHGKQVDSVSTLIGRLEAMNFLDDEDITTVIQRLKKEVISKSSDERSIDDIRDALADIKLDMRQQLSALDLRRGIAPVALDLDDGDALSIEGPVTTRTTRKAVQVAAGDGFGIDTTAATFVSPRKPIPVAAAATL